MQALFLAHYDEVTPASFQSDLHAKDEVLLLIWVDAPEGEQLVGFTCLSVFEREWRGERVRIVYSGDTVVERAHWGQQALAFGWISRIGQIKRAAPTLPLYWFVIVKGHRTFKYLPVFGRSFWPHWSIDRSDLKPLADALATERFGADYNAERGVVEFARSRGQLKPELTAPTPEELLKDSVRFFLERNPGYRQGHELVCLCEMEERNMKPLTLRLFRKAGDDG